MNNYELHQKAQESADTQTAYSLARQLLELEEVLQSLTERCNGIEENES